MLGHSSVAFTLDVYSHTVPRLQETAVKKLDDILYLRLTPEKDVSKPLAINVDLRSASGRSRTDDLRFTKPLLYQLSYAGASQIIA